ncbi:peroxynitrite isomerase THAP4 isoform X3 [Dermacentor silvarum]|uniref:peroxynitrite isomerase THAP4 isoform X3 n=1 Tax=Dermacentor silvarum TaxID=543639 RepID=UPI0021008ADF|nr:peroxynitrite isomerase THAP4 isoform X3 [Dermacentor silvarum]
MPGCCVPKCANHSRNGWRFFHFPTNPERRSLWLIGINRGNWQPTKWSSVCSAHFEEDSFEQNRADGWKKLKPNAVPTLFPPRESSPKRKAPKGLTGAAAPSGASDNSIVIDGADSASTQVEVHLVSPSNGADLSRQESCIGPQLAISSRTPRRRTIKQEPAALNAASFDPPCSNSSCAELRQQLADMTRRHDQLLEAYGIANSTVNALTNKVGELQSTVENFRQCLIQPRNDVHLQVLPRKKNHSSIHTQ